ncbi:MAG: tetratricopeptide repeat protein [Saprospiraceae bacterium]|nr:tetratricopeptide repeat protein [Saprospiraceae bacterium]
MKTALLSLLTLPLWVFGQTEKGVAPMRNTSSGNTQTRAVVIGISDYQDAQIPDLRFADRDAEAFANFLRSPAGGSLEQERLQVLLNQNATAGRVAEAFDALLEQTKEGEQVVIYYSGHGDVERKTVSQPGFLLCWDAPSRVYMGGGTYSLAYLQEIVTTLSTQNKAKVVVITDACHAGKLAGSQIGGAQLTAANLAKQFANEIKILSCQPGELSLEGEQWGGGRGIFSYHLINGLFGLADKNADGQVTLGELDRYLEDYVTTEAAPQSQVPMLLGNKTEKLAAVNAQLLADLKKAKSGELAVFASIEGRGLEEDVLAKADSGTREGYVAFKKAVEEKRFFHPENDCADQYYAQLEVNGALAPLRGIMKRNYAAALQDFAQQSINTFLKADVQQLECLGNSPEFDSIPSQLARAAELLGEQHYMYRSLMARKLLFEGIILRTSSLTLDPLVTSQCLSLFRQSMALEPQSPLVWFNMSLLYSWNLPQPDSAFFYAQEATNLAPNWVLPYAELAYSFIHKDDLALSRKALEAAEAIDPQHPYVINRWATWHKLHGDRENLEKAVALFEKYRDGGGAVYPCWFSDYAGALKELGRNEEAEAAFFKALELDSAAAPIWANLGYLYIETGRFDEAEQVLGEAIALDSTYFAGWYNLAMAYMYTRRYAEAEKPFKKAISIDSTYATAWGNLGAAFNMTGRFAEAEPYLLKSIALDSTNIVARANLGFSYTGVQRYADAEKIYKYCLDIDSNYVTAWNNLGYIYLITSRLPEAEAALRKAILFDSTAANTRKHLGTVCFKTNRPEEARQQFLKALELSPNYAAAMLGLAYVSAQTLARADATASAKTSAAMEALDYVEQAIEKGSTYEQLEKDADLAPLRTLPEWTALMKKHFPDQGR